MHCAARQSFPQAILHHVGHSGVNGNHAPPVRLVTPRAINRMTQQAGIHAEDIALRHLEAQGLRLIQRNWRTRFGEIDLVLKDGETIVFVEVRLRSNPRFGGPAESIDRRKQSKLIAAARLYSVRFPRGHFRIDAVLIDRIDPPRVEWIRNAVSA
jgi:putative endonuclease